MSDGSLSQDEIDALLSGGFDSGIGSEVQPKATSQNDLSGKDIESLRGLLTKNSSNLSEVLRGLISEPVSLKLGTLASNSKQSLTDQLTEEVVVISANFSGDVNGTHKYILSVEVASLIAGKMMGLDNVDLDDSALSALEEAGNVIAGSSVTLLSNETGKSINAYSVSATKNPKSGLTEIPDPVVRAIYQGSINGLEDVNIIEVFSNDVAKGLISAPAQQQQSQQQDSNFFGGGPSMAANSVQFPNLNETRDSKEYGNIGLLMDVFMEMTVELGRTKKLIKDILSMGEGTIIELDKLAGEPVDILVNHKLIAKGEVVVIDENFGVRVTEIISPMERVSNMV
ncbi:MAG: flagellar motor switch protein FliN [Spirochaetales bacterium]|nr:flagellar motor switch protein FliN [Spirochaetales bacterium]